MERKKISKRDYEGNLISIVGHEDLAASKYSEFDHEKGKDIPMTLYYYKDIHVGTWCQSQGWIFDFAENPKTLQEQVDKHNDMKNKIKEMK